MSVLAPPLLSRARQGVRRPLRDLRDRLEWHTARTIQGETPWCRNRWGQRYQALSLTEYHELRHGNPESPETAMLERRLTPGMTVVDVGANLGLFALEAAHLVGNTGRVHAFEPAPRTRERLRSNLDANGLSDLVQVFSCALGLVPGTARLRVHHDRSRLNTLAPNDVTWNRVRIPADEVIEVPVETLDDHARRHGLDRIDVLKIDVEGFELSVLRGARRLLAQRAVRGIMLEVGDVTCANAWVQPFEIHDYLIHSGYTLHAITANGDPSAPLECFPEPPFSANFLALPGDAA